MKWEVSNINAKTANSQNDFDVDMCIANATILFYDVIVENIVFGVYTSRDSKVNLTKYPSVIVESEDRLDVMKSFTNEYCYIYAMEEFAAIEGNRYRARFHIDFNTYLTLVFSKTVIAWDAYDGKAWYEHEKWK